MTDSLSITPDSGRVRTFLCPACHETIALGCERCRFCGVAIDQQAAAAAAELMDRVNAAINEANDIREIVQRLWALDLSSTEGVGRFSGSIEVPARLVRWWIRFGAVQVIDDDMRRARKDMFLYSLVAVAIVVLFIASLVNRETIDFWLRVWHLIRQR